MPTHIFSSSAVLQDFLLHEAGPGTLVVVSHQRLAHQVWHRQRLTKLEAGRAAWEPLPLKTLEGWWADLFRALWPPVSLAPPLMRLAIWRQALQAAPALAGPVSDLAWAQALDETYHLLCRHLLPTTGPTPADSPLTAWRRQVTQNFLELLRQERLISEGEVPTFLLTALETGKIALPKQIWLAGFQTPAPAEEAWLKAVAQRTRLVRLQVKGDPQAVQKAVVLPDGRQELEWVAAQAVESACRDGFPWHRLAITSLALDTYTTQLPRVLTELLGPSQTAEGWAYNFAKGPRLADMPLFAAALLPLKFSSLGERREDLISLLLSPYYGSLKPHQVQGTAWDRLFRDRRLDQGWKGFRQAVAQDPGSTQSDAEMLKLLDQVWGTLRGTPATGRQWAARLNAVWEKLGFSADLEEVEQAAWDRVTSLTQELEAALASEALSLREFLEWLTHGASQRLVAGPGVQEAGLQVLGLLEMRGLDFSRVWCLGMNSGVFPPPPRHLPLLTAQEKGRVLGGTYQSQHHFARQLYETFLGTAREIVLTRPRLKDQEETVATSIYEGEWLTDEMAPLSRPHRAWLMAPAVQAALTVAAGGGPVAEAAAPISLSLPPELYITQAQTALSCPCRFLLEILLEIKELPEIEAGLDPSQRGELIHKVLARFAVEFKKILDRDEGWDHGKARELLKAATRQLLAPRLADPHWQAEGERWLAEDEAAPGLLWEWLDKERERFEQGWRWQGIEARFQDLKGPGWPFSLKGRLDRLDYHLKTKELVIWDYKTGKIPAAKQVFAQGEENQLPGYLLAVKQGRVKVPEDPGQIKAGFIGLKSSRQKHLRYEDFGSQADQWQAVVEAWEGRLKALGRLLAAGDFTPNPTPPPEGRQQGACKFCPYPLVCSFVREPALEEGEEEEDM